MHSLVLIAPDAARDAANVLAEGLGWGPCNLVVPLSATGAEPVTHWACRADVTEGFLALLADPPEGAGPLLASLTVDLVPFAASDLSPRQGHFAAVLARLELAVVSEGDEA